MEQKKNSKKSQATSSKKTAVKREKQSVTFATFLKTADRSPEELNTLRGALISSVGAIYNPTTGIGSIRIGFRDLQPKDFDKLSTTQFAALLSILQLPNLSYNGQYIMGATQNPLI